MRVDVPIANVLTNTKRTHRSVVEPKASLSSSVKTQEELVFTGDRMKPYRLDRHSQSCRSSRVHGIFQFSSPASPNTPWMAGESGSVNPGDTDELVLTRRHINH